MGSVAQGDAHYGQAILQIVIFVKSDPVMKEKNQADRAYHWL
jgi:hypothetical protein